jgi:hypothetical protein
LRVHAVLGLWERLLADHFRNIKDPENALVSRELWFDNLPAVMRVRITTPNVGLGVEFVGRRPRRSCWQNDP